jgi:very-short-patch-repair endonuclease
MVRGGLLMNEEKRHHIQPELLERARSLRKDQTSAETKLWTILRNRQLQGFKFRRQQPIGRFIVDFYCSENKLVVEIDGDTHAERKEYDTNRTQWLENEGYQVIRFTNDEVLTNLENVALEILSHCESEKGNG